MLPSRSSKTSRLEGRSSNPAQNPALLPFQTLGARSDCDNCFRMIKLMNIDKSTNVSSEVRFTMLASDKNHQECKGA